MRHKPAEQADHSRQLAPCELGSCRLGAVFSRVGHRPPTVDQDFAIYWLV